MKMKPDELAEAFLALSPKEFDQFWRHVCFVWNMDGDENDMEGAWFMAGKAMKPDGLTAISAMHSAVASGRKSARGTP